MNQKKYYSQRKGKLEDSPELTLKLFKRLFLFTYNQLERDGYFQKYFGFYCVDGGELSGELGPDIPTVVFLTLRKEALWPINENIEGYSEDDLFTIIEYLHDHCSKPLDGSYHSWNDCGWHYNKFDDEKGRSEYRKKINDMLADYKEGFELSPEGEILSLPDSNLGPLLDANIPSTDEENVTLKVDNAISKFRRHRSSLEDRRSALRELADVLEYLRPSIKEALMSNDEKDIFNLANNFGIRHHNANQKVKYDKAIWYSWMFYYYLATIHASLRLIDKEKQ
ncbi:hypothetical protein [Pedobacter nutrimenti]|uniref:hypothetical protein n=1 Tax=Pedobacter nutrimenti TaxID=1241337 RepID=UPI00292CC891|nr:hypothetical protein [Pedobacter nutrimenti]